ISKRIDEASYGSAFVISDFTDLAEYETAKKTIARLEKNNTLRRVLRGVYDKPMYSSLLQEYAAPNPDSIAHAIARNYNWTISASGNTALNLLGLSTQVPANWSYISSGPYKDYSFGKVKLTFSHRSDSQVKGMSEKTLLLIQALKAIGQKNVSNTDILLIRKRISSEEYETVLLETRHTINWVHEVIKEICREEG
ncbi:MAG: hypothetical protein IJ091_11235, partial [Oscillospiraceae bacterium]|nr:hypothetical protein [Oscillospiraceae bacterium]